MERVSRQYTSLRGMFLAGVIACAVGGCAMPITAAKEDTTKALATAERHVVEMDQAHRKTGAVTRYPGDRIAGDEVMVSVDKVKRPKIFDEAFQYNTPPGQTLQEVAESASKLLGLSLRIGAVQDGQPGATGVPMPGAPIPAPIGGGSVPSGVTMISFTGTVAGFLDMLAERTQSYWRESGGVVEFFRTETRTFQVYLPRKSVTVSQSISLTGSGSSSGGSSGGASGGGSSAAGSVSVSSGETVDAYDALVQAVQSLVSEPGRGGVAPANAGQGAQPGGVGRPAVVANRPLGMITVTARPPVLDRVAEYVKSINERFSQNVFINVRVLSLDVNRDAAVGVSANAILADAGGRYGLRLTGGANPSGGAGGTPGVLNATVTSSSGSSSVDLFLRALSTYGTVSQVTSGSVLAVNGQPSPLQMANDIGYIASSTTTLVPNVGAQTTFTPGSVRVGLTGNFTPLVLGDNRILLDYSLTLSSATITQVASSGPNAAVVSTPNVSSRALQQSAFLRDGEAIVLLGFDQVRSSHDHSTGITSIGSAGSTQRQLTVIVMEVFGGRV